VAIGDRQLRILLSLDARDALPRGGRVVEIGAQQMADAALGAFEELDTLRGRFGRTACPLPPPDRGAGLHLRADAPPARDFWNWLGYEYEAIDIDGARGALAMDLNFADAPPHLRGGAQIVTNFGTTEHIANQYNAFRVMHDLATTGGLLMHTVPSQGQFNHGLINYNAKFFMALAKANDYQWLHFDFVARPITEGLPSGVIEHMIPFAPDISERLRDYRAVFYNLDVVLKKARDTAFAPPIDLA
jgi:hypothetical protein